MMMSAPTRKLMLTMHVLSSIGWFGGLLVFAAHSIASLVSGDPNTVPYKPAGLTRFGSAGERRALPRWVRISLIVSATLTLVLALLVMHGGHGPTMHSLHTPS